MTKTKERYEARAAALGLRLARHPRTRFGTERIDIYVRGGGKQVGTAYNHQGLGQWLAGYAAGRAEQAAEFHKGFNHGAA